MEKGRVGFIFCSTPVLSTHLYCPTVSHQRQSFFCCQRRDNLWSGLLGHWCLLRVSRRWYRRQCSGAGWVLVEWVAVAQGVDHRTGFGVDREILMFIWCTILTTHSSFGSSLISYSLNGFTVDSSKLSNSQTDENSFKKDYGREWLLAATLWWIEMKENLRLEWWLRGRFLIVMQNSFTRRLRQFNHWKIFKKYEGQKQQGVQLKEKGLKIPREAVSITKLFLFLSSTWPLGNWWISDSHHITKHLQRPRNWSRGCFSEDPRK